MRFENYWYWKEGRGRSAAADALAGFAGWLLLLVIDPQIAWMTGIPLAVLLVALWRKYTGKLQAGRSSIFPSRWARRRSRLIVVLLVPLIGISFVASIVCGAVSVAIGVIVTLVILGTVEFVARRKGGSLLGRYPLAMVSALLLASTAMSLISFEMGLGALPNETFLKRVSQPSAPPVWSYSAKLQAVRAVRALLSRLPQDKTDDVLLLDLHRTLAPVTPQLITAPSPNGLYISLYAANGVTARGHISRAVDGLEAVLMATQIALRQLPFNRFSAAQQELRLSNASIQIDVPGASRPIPNRPLIKFIGRHLEGWNRETLALNPLGELLSFACDIEPGIDGLHIEVADRSGSATMLPSDPVTGGWLTPRVEGNPAAIKTMLIRTLRREFGITYDLGRIGFKLNKFRTTSFGAVTASEVPIDWYRANRLIGGQLTRARLMNGIVQAADWLSRQVRQAPHPQEIGLFHYESFPPYRPSTDDYSLPRHAGASYGLFAYYRDANGRSPFSESAQRALEAGIVSLKPLFRKLRAAAGANSAMACFLEDNGDAYSGSAALAALALVELIPPAQVQSPELRAAVAAVPVDRSLAALGNCMLTMIDPSGAVFYSYRDSKKNKRVDKEPLYFPGEVLLALVKTDARIHDARLLEGAKRIADRQLRQYRWNLAFALPRSGDHWMIQGLAELAVTAKDRRYAELSLLQGRGYLREQFPPIVSFYPDYFGTYYRSFDVPRTTRAASRGEALGGAVKAARFLGKDTSALDRALISGARHLLEQQFGPENSYFVPAGFDVKGAIRMGLVDNHCRIDNNQHALVALLRALQAMDRQARPLTAALNE